MAYTTLHSRLIGIFKLAFASGIAGVLVGCATPASYTEPIIKFQKASTVVIESARIDYAGANAYERNAIIDRLAAQKKKFGLADISGSDHDVITPEDLRSRMLALEAISKHCQLLLTLASNDAAARSREAALQTGDALGRLSEALNNAPGSEFKAKAAAAGVITGQVVEAAIQAKITEALNNAIAKSEAPIAELIRQLRSDMNGLYERRRSILSESRVLAVRAYNNEVGLQNPSVERIDKAAANLKRAITAFEDSSLLVGTGQGLDAMADAHQQLAAYARSAKSPQNLSNLVDAVDAFLARAVVISDALNTIHNTTKE